MSGGLALLGLGVTAAVVAGRAHARAIAQDRPSAAGFVLVAAMALALAGALLVLDTAVNP